MLICKLFCGFRQFIEACQNGGLEIEKGILERVLPVLNPREKLFSWMISSTFLEIKALI